MKRFSSLRRIGILLLVLTLVMGLAISASAATMTQDGVQVTLTTDKDKYEANEKITPKVTVKNLNDYAVKDVKVEVSAPSGYVVSGDKTVTYATMNAGESKQPAASVAAKPVVTPSTGDTSPIFLWGGLLLLVAALLVGMFVFFRKGNLKLMSVFLAVVMVVGMIPVAVFAADVTKSMTVTETVTVGTKKVDISVKVTYTIQDEPEDPTEGTEPEGTTAGTTAGATESTTAPTTGGDADIPEVNLPEDARTIYVSATAKAGEGNGSFENPYANMNEAKAAIRKIKANGDYPEEGITVYFREGKYSIMQTILLEEADSGREGAPVVYTAYNNENVEFIGGFSIDASAFSAVTDAAVLNRLADKTNVKQLNLKALGITDYGEMHVYGSAASYFTAAGIPIPTTPAPEIFFNSEVMSVAKYPNDGWLKIASVKQVGDVIQNWTNAAHGNDYIPPEDRPPIDQIKNSIYTVQSAVKSRMARWTEASDIWVYGFWKEDWSDQSMPVKSIDPATGTVETGIPSGKKITINRKFYFYNLLEEIDAPGEYYMDRQSGILYAYLPAAEGTVTYGALEGAAVRFDTGAHDIEINGINFSAGRTNGIELESAKNITIKNSDFSLFAKVGITMNNCRDILITGCHVYETGTGGIATWYNADSQPWKTARKTLEPLGIVVENCEIHDYSRLMATYAPGVSTAGVGMVVRNCKIYNADHYAISLSGNDTLIENCEIFNVLRTVSDSGAIYSGFAKQDLGLVVRNNFFHDIGSSAGEDVSVIYMDDTKDGVTFESNLLVNIGGRGALINGGWDNNFRNNVLINVAIECQLGCIGTTGTLRYDIMESGNYDAFVEIYNAKYPAYNKYPHWEGKLEKLLEQSAYNAPRYNVVEDNVLVNVRTTAPNAVSYTNLWSVADSMANNTIKAGHAYGLDEIGFADYKNGDFNISKDSVLFDDIEGFVAPDFSKMGLYGVGCEKPKGFGGNGYDEEEEPDDGGDESGGSTVVTGPLFAEDFSESNAMETWEVGEPDGSSTQIKDGALEVTFGSTGIYNAMAAFEAYAGKTVYEMDFKIELNGCTSVDAGVIIVKGLNDAGSEKSLFNLKTYTSGKTFGAYDGGGGIRNSVMWEEGVTYRIKIVCDPENDTYDFYVDGQPVIIGGKMRADAGNVVSFSGFAINQQNAQGGAAKFTYDNILVTPATMTLFKEDFSDANALMTWDVAEPDGSSTQIKDGALEVTFGSTGIYNAMAPFEAFEGKVTFETDFKIELNGCSSVDAGVFIIKGLNDAGSEKSLFNLKTYTSGKTFGAYDGGGGIRNTVTWSEGVTYRIQVVCDPDTDTYDFYVDGKPVIVGGKMRTDAGDVVSFTGFAINQQNAQGGVPKFTYDNILVVSGDNTENNVPPADDNEDEPGDAVTGMLYQEDFSDPDALDKWDLSAPAGFTIEVNKDGALEIAMGGTGSVNHNVFFEDFVEQKGKVTYEMDYRVDLNGCYDVDPNIFVVRSNSTSLLNLKVYLDKTTGKMVFGAYDGTDGTKQGEHPTEIVCEDGMTYKIVVVVDSQTDTYDYYANGVAVIKDGHLRTKTDFFTGLQLTIHKSTASEGIPVAYYDNIVVRAGGFAPVGNEEADGVLAADDFSGDLSKWNIGSSTAAKIKDGGLEVTLNAGNTGGVFYSLLETISSNQKTAVEFDLKVNGDDASTFEAGFMLKDASSTTVVNVAAKQGKLMAQYGPTSAVIENGQIYRIKVVTDPDAKTVDVYVNGEKVADGLGYLNGATAWNTFMLMIKGNNATSSLSAVYDNFKISLYQEEPEVEEPKDPENPDESEDPEEDISGGEILVSDDFSGDLSKWNIGDSNAVTIKNGALVITQKVGAGNIFYTLSQTIPSDKKVAIEFDLTVNGDLATTFEAGFLLKNGNTTAANVALTKGQLWAQWSRHSEGFECGKAYSIKVVSDPETKTIDVYVDNVKVAQKLGFLNGATSWETFMLMVKGNNGSADLNAVFDNFKISVY